MAEAIRRSTLTPLDELVTRKQLARAIGVTVKTIDAWVDKGMPRLKFPGPRGAVRFRMGSVVEWVATLEGSKL